MNISIQLFGDFTQKRPYDKWKSIFRCRNGFNQEFQSNEKTAVCYYKDSFRLYSLIVRIEKVLRTFPEQELTEKSTQ